MAQYHPGLERAMIGWLSPKGLIEPQERFWMLGRKQLGHVQHFRNWRRYSCETSQEMSNSCVLRLKLFAVFPIQRRRLVDFCSHSVFIEFSLEHSRTSILLYCEATGSPIKIHEWGLGRFQPMYKWWQWRRKSRRYIFPFLSNMYIRGQSSKHHQKRKVAY